MFGVLYVFNKLLNKRRENKERGKEKERNIWLIKRLFYDGVRDGVRYLVCVAWIY